MVVVGGGYIGMEVAAAAVGWKLDTTVCLLLSFMLVYYFVVPELNAFETLSANHFQLVFWSVQSM